MMRAVVATARIIYLEPELPAVADPAR